MANFHQDIDYAKLSNGNNGVSDDEVKCSPPSGIDVLIVGAGIGGLCTALECHRKGHTVRILERASKASAAGDIVIVDTSTLKFFDHYPALKREAEQTKPRNMWMRYCKWTGEGLTDPYPQQSGYAGSEYHFDGHSPPKQSLQRPILHKILYNQLSRFGIEVRFGTRVFEYFEDVERGIGGVVTADGERVEADLVIAADGLNSRSQGLVPDSTEKAKPTGRTAFRGAFPLDVAQADPLVKETFGLKDGRDAYQQVWTGPDITAVVQSYVDQKGENGRFCFVLVVREPDAENQGRKESWYETITREEMLRVLETLAPGWHPAFKALVNVTPPDTIVAWPLNPRNTKWTWHSPGARVLQLGDSAHSFLPNAGNGAGQALEDSVTIAECLLQAGRKDVPLAVRVHNLLRADRCSCCQLMGYVNAERLHHSSSEKSQNGVADPKKIGHHIPKWQTSLDPEKYAIENFKPAAESFKGEGGRKFVNTNIPRGYTPKSWTIREMEELHTQGKRIELEGDWS